MYTYYITNTCI